MSLAKTVDGMAYEQTGSKKVNGKSVATKYANQMSTSSLIWLLVKRHKMGLLVTGNIILVLNWAIPEWVNILVSLARATIQ